MVLTVSMLNLANVQPLIGVVNAVDGAGAEIQLVKTVNATTIISGTDVQYTLNVTNIGNQTLYNVTVVDDTLDFVLDPVSFSPTLAPGQSNVTLINVTISGAGTLTNIATANGTTVTGALVTDSDTVSVLVYLWLIESCDSSGVRKDTFIVGDDVYVNGTGFGNATTYSLYVVEDQTWINNMTIPARIPGTATTVTSLPDGTIPPTLIWANPLTPGKYDIIIDTDNNTIYTEFIDALDDNDVEVTAGFFVVPEFAIGSVMAIASMFAALGLYAYKKKHQTTK